MTRTALLLVAAAAMLLAGCSAPIPDANELSDEQARALLAAASDALPARFSYTLDGAAGNGTRVLQMQGVRNGSELYVATDATDTLLGSAAASGAGAGAAARLAPALAHGIELYAGPSGALYMLNGTAIVFPPGESALGGQVPNPARALDNTTYSADVLVGLLQHTGLNVTGIAPTLHDGRLAWRIDFEAPRDDATVRGHALVTADPARLVSLDVTLPAPSSVARLVLELGDPKPMPAHVLAALRMGHASDANPFGSMFSRSDTTTTTWTFLAAEPVPLDGLEVVAKGAGVPLDLAAAPTLWAMPLADLERTVGNATVAYDDADGDGHLSRGDTVTVRTSGSGTPPRFAMHDAETGAYAVAPIAILQAVLGS